MILVDEETAMLDWEGLTYDVISDADVDKIDKIDNFEECASDCVAVITILNDEDDDNDSIEDEDDLITLVDLDECDSDVGETIRLDDIDCKCNELDVVKMLKFNDLEASDLDDDFKVIELFDLEPTGLDDEAATLDSDAEIGLVGFTEKFIESDDFVTMDMFDLETSNLGGDDELPLFETIELEDVNDKRIENKSEEACGINGVEAVAIDSDTKIEPDEFNEKCIELNNFVAMEMFDTKTIDLGDDDEFAVFETIGLKDVNGKLTGNENEEAYGMNDVDSALLDADREIEPDNFNDKYMELDDFVSMDMFDLETTNLGDDDELPLFETIELEDINEKRIENKGGEACGINGVEAVAIDSDTKIEPDEFNEKCIELDNFVAMEMFDTKTIDLGDDDEFAVFETIGLKDVNGKLTENENEEAYGMNDVDSALLDADGEIESDSFNDKYMELDDFVSMDMFDLETTNLGDDDELPLFETIELEDINDKRIENKGGEACGINGVEAVVIDSDTKIEPDEFNEKCIELDNFVAMEMFDTKTTDLGDDDEFAVFETIGLKDVNGKLTGNENEEAYGMNDVDSALLDADGEAEPDNFNDKYMELDDFISMDMFDLETTNLGDDDELPLFETIELEDVNDKCIENKGEEACGINGVEEVVIDSDTKMEPDEFNEKCIELDNFVAMEMFDTKTTDLSDDDEFAVFETIRLKDVNGKLTENENEEAYGINGVEVALLDVDEEIEPDDFNDKFIELDDFVTMDMFDLETTILGDDDDELPLFEIIELEDINDKCIENKGEEACGINGVEAVVIDSDTKIEPDEFNEKCIELDNFVAMEMFDTKTTNLGDDDEFAVFETIGLKDVNGKLTENENEEAYGINSVEVALLDVDGEIEPDDFNDKLIELDDFLAMEIIDLESIDLSNDDELPVFETIGLEGVNDKWMANVDEGAYGINGVEVAGHDSDAKMKPDEFSEKCIELDDFVTMEIFDIETTDLDDDDKFSGLETIGLEDVNDKRIENKDEEAFGISNVEVALLDADGETEPGDASDKCIELNGFVAIEMFDLEMTDLNDDDNDELPVFEKAGPEDVNDKLIENEDEEACGTDNVEVAFLDTDRKPDPDIFNDKCIELNDFVAMEMFDIGRTNLGDDDGLPVFETIGLDDVNGKGIVNEDEEVYGTDVVEAAVIDSNPKMEPDDFNKKCIEPNDFVPTKMFDIETTDFSDDDELPLLEAIGLEDANDRCIVNEDERACGIIDVEVALLPADGEIEPDDFNDKCIELDDFVSMEMFDLEKADLSDDEELSLFETIELEDVKDKRIANEDERAYGINDVEAAVLDSDSKMKSDDSNEKCLELEDFLAMEMFDIGAADLGDNDELPVFETIELDNVNNKPIPNEDEEPYGINQVEVALPNTDGEIETDDFNDKCIELNNFAGMEMFDTERTDLGNDDELPVFETIGLNDVNGKRIVNENEEVYGIDSVEAAVIDSNVKMEPDDVNEKCIEPNNFVVMEMFDIEMTDLSDDDDELPVFETIGLDAVNNECIANEDEEGYGINEVEVALPNTDGEIEPDDFNDKCIELNDFVAIEMFDLETTDLDDEEEEEELPVFEKIGLEDVSNKRIENEDEETCGINNVEVALLDTDREIELDDFSDKCIELNDSVAMEMFDIERTDLGDDDELPVFEATELEDVNEKRIANENEEAYGTDGVEAAVIDSDGKVKPDDFNEKCIELDGVVAIEMFDIEAIDLDDDDELPMFETI